MPAPSDHFLLYAEASRSEHAAPRWKFVLQSVGNDERMSAADFERDSRPSRLELLAVVRGLEAIDRPSRVTLLTRSRYVTRGIRRQLDQWREHKWRWERFGQFVLIRDHDLWQRVDRALQIHRVECCVWQVEDEIAQFDAASSPPTAKATSWLAPWQSERRLTNRFGSLIAAALGKLRRGVLTPFSAPAQPTYTRAA